MGEVVNLRTERKRRRREDEARRADENRIRHGLTKAAKDAARNERHRADAALEGHRIVPSPDDKEPA
jgi:hypothetical protein